MYLMTSEYELSVKFVIFVSKTFNLESGLKGDPINNDPYSI